MLDKHKSVISHSLFAVCWLALFIVSSFLDLQISHALSNSKLFFGALFEKVGEIPAYIIAPICVTILFKCDFSDKKKTNIIYKAIFIVLMYISYLVWFLNSSKLVEIPHSTAFAFVYAIGFTIFSLAVSKLLNKNSCQKLAKWAVFALVTMIVTLLVIKIMKMAWGRMRYRDMLGSGSFDGFTPWYKLNGLRKGDFTSFPSGHTASAANIFVFAVLADYCVSLKKYQPLIYVLSTTFVVLTAIARIVYNAHFLSDVLVGGLVSYLIYFGCKKLFFKNGFEFKDKKKEKNNE